MIPTYIFISQIYGDFVHAFYILVHMKVIIFNFLIDATTIYHQSDHDVTYAVIWAGTYPHSFKSLLG